MSNRDDAGSPTRNLWRCARAAAALLFAATAALVVGAPPASAGASLTIAPDFPASVSVGQTNVPASVLVQNFSAHPYNVGDVIIESITLVPSCAVFDASCSGNADPGALMLSATGTGASGTNCAGKTFNIVVTDASTGQVAFNPVGGAVALAPPNASNALDTCRINFTFSVQNVPNHDSQPTGGIQTNQLARVTAVFGDGTLASASGSDFMTVNSPITAPGPIAVFRSSGGYWFFHDGPTVQWGTSGDIAVPADYNGDGTEDIAVFRPASGVWFIRDGATVAFGTVGDVPVPADYDGDGDDEIAVFRPSTGFWFIQGGPIVQFGTSGDVPVPADYDGDGNDEIAVFRPSTGVWFSRDGETVAFGTVGDVPVPADYDGDGDDEIAVFRPSTGFWFIQGGPIVQFGTSGDVPVPADYDGDGNDEIAVFRPSTGVWFIRDGETVAFGTAGDEPLPLPAAVREHFFS